MEGALLEAEMLLIAKADTIGAFERLCYNVR